MRTTEETTESFSSSSESHYTTKDIFPVTTLSAPTDLIVTDSVILQSTTLEVPWKDDVTILPETTQGRPKYII